MMILQANIMKKGKFLKFYKSNLYGRHDKMPEKHLVKPTCCLTFPPQQKVFIKLYSEIDKWLNALA